MSIIRVAIALALLVSIEPRNRLSAQIGNPNGTWMQESGDATEADRGSAVSEATDAATDRLNRDCVLGTIVEVAKISTSCDKQDDGDGNAQYSCHVTEKGLCK